MVKIAAMAIVACMPASARSWACSTAVVTNLDNGYWGCTITPRGNRTVFSNVGIKVDSFFKQAGCGSDDSTTWKVVITCDGTRVGEFPDAGHAGFLNHNGDHVDYPMSGTWTCASSFRMDMVNTNSLGGSGACRETYSGLQMVVDDSPFCSRDTGGTCSIFNCNGWRGNTSCVDGECLCQPGYCSSESGVCIPLDAQVSLDGSKMMPSGDAETTWNGSVNITASNDWYGNSSYEIRKIEDDASTSEAVMV